MSINKAKGNMFQFIEATWNPLAGKCPHICGYCYAINKPFTLTKKYQGKPRIHPTSLDDDLSKYNSYFVANMTDLFAKEVPENAIKQILNHCKKWEDNIYLFLTKNPQRYHEFLDELPEKSVLGTTLETNRVYKDTDAPPSTKRAEALRKITEKEKMISVEPVMDFDLNEFVQIIRTISPSFIAIGADSKGNNLNEPEKQAVLELINKLKDNDIQTHLKTNIKRIIGKEKKQELHEGIRSI